ncbi:hypothetical protein ACFOEE_11195 [Pseudoalteromonas fenneropenaei]|uniref:Uncharacterized protein n=1 Tax=Pseudoalteromonas fenneropenaei TaxID=1737459 RepID=A0ABV7CKD5_9GAMM
MKALVFSISLVAFLTPFKSLLFSQSVKQAVKSDREVATVEFIGVDVAPIPLEMKWHNAYISSLENVNTDKPIEINSNNVANTSKQVFFEDKRFELVGIFHVSGKAFVLLKTDEGNLVKVTEDQSITNSVSVHKIGSDFVTFSERGQQVAELKLFKWQSNNEAVE